MANPFTSDMQFLLNRMNSIARKVGLGDLMADLFTPASELTLANGKILVGDASNVAQAVTPSGDVTMSNAGVNAIGASKVLLSMVSTAVLGEATGTLTQANLVAMNGAAVTLMAAPGAGKVIIPVELEFFHSYSTAAYTNGGVLSVQYHGSTVITEHPATLVTAAASHSYWARPTLFDLDNATGTGNGAEVTSLANLAIEITNATAAFAAGNASNVLKWRIRYRLITLLT